MRTAFVRPYSPRRRAGLYAGLYVFLFSRFRSACWWLSPPPPTPSFIFPFFYLSVKLFAGSRINSEQALLLAWNQKCLEVLMKTKCEARLSHLSPASPAKSSALQLINGSAIWNASVPWSNAWGESGAELGAGSPDGDLCEADPTAVQALPARLRFHSCTRAIAGSKRSREASMLLLCSLSLTSPFSRRYCLAALQGQLAYVPLYAAFSCRHELL